MNEHLVARAAVGDGRATTPGSWPRPFGRDVLDLLDDDADGFDFALRELRAELAPATVLERLLVDQIVLSAGRLRASTEAERLGRPTSEWVPQAEVARQGLDAAVDRLAQWRESRPLRSPWEAGWRDDDRTASAATVAVELPDEAATDDEEEVSWLDRDEPIPFSRLEPGPGSGREQGDVGWRSRLEFDDRLNDDWPVVRGTRIDAGRIVTLVIDGRTWREILFQHPELEEADVRACLAYAVEQEGPFEPAFGDETIGMPID